MESPLHPLSELVEENYRLLATLDVAGILGYLHASHLYYIETALPRLDRAMQALIAATRNGEILSRFFADYRREVDSHFAYEEQTVFPYVRSLLDGRRRKGFSILDFEDNHSDIEGKLSDLKSILTNHLPDDVPGEVRYEALYEIFRFEEDLLKHTLIEDHLFVPLVEKLERSVGHE